ncbi:MAG: hypothetical protein UMV23_05335 [Halanaerobium sp.]|nr:hypothetical protein [Halanaerobium sp.]
MKNNFAIGKVVAIMAAAFILLAGLGQAAEIPPWPDGWSREELVSGDINLNTLNFNMAVDNTGDAVYYLRAMGLVNEMNLGLFRYEPGQGYQLSREFSRGAMYIKNSYVIIDEQGRKRLVWTEERRRKDYSKYYLLQYAILDRNNGFLLKPQELFQDDYPLSDLRVKEGPDGFTHIFWTGRGQYDYHGFHLAADTMGQLALPPQAVIKMGHTVNRGDFYLTADGSLHIAWTQVEDDGEHLYYAVYNQNRELLREPVDFGVVSLFAVDQMDGRTIQLERCYPRLTGWDDRVALVWNQIPGGSRAQYAYNIELQFFSQKGDFIGERIELSSYNYLSTHPDVAVLGDRMAVAWHEVMGDFSHVFFAEVNKEGEVLQGRMRLDLKKATALRPKIVIAGTGNDYLIFWTRVGEDGGYLASKNTIYPEEPSLWYKLGIGESQPIQSLLYVFVTDLLLAFVYSIPSFMVVAIGFFALSLLGRWVGDKWLDDNFNLVCFFLFSLFFVLKDTILFPYKPFPIPATLQWINFIISTFLVTFFFNRLRRDSGWPGLKTSMGKLLISYAWVYFYTFLIAIPQLIYQLNK